MSESSLESLNDCSSTAAAGELEIDDFEDDSRRKSDDESGIASETGLPSSAVVFGWNIASCDSEGAGMLVF